jgi:hypothetical protein
MEIGMSLFSILLDRVINVTIVLRRMELLPTILLNSYPPQVSLALLADVVGVALP